MLCWPDGLYYWAANCADGALGTCPTGSLGVLELAQKFGRNIADLVVAKQLASQVGHKAGCHLRIGQCSVIATRQGQLGGFVKYAPFVAWCLRKPLPRDEHGAGKLLPPAEPNTVKSSVPNLPSNDALWAVERSSDETAQLMRT